MAYITPPVTENLDEEERRVYRRYRPDLPVHLLGNIFWQDQDEEHPYPGYYLVDSDNQIVPVEFIENYWYLLSFRTFDQTFWTDTESRFEPFEDGTGYWDLTDPQHPEHLLHEAGPSDLTAPRSRADTLELDRSPSVPRFATNPDTDDEEDTVGPSSGFQTATQPTPVEPECTLEEEILVAQFQSELDIQDREPENPFEPDVPHYQSLVAEAVSAGLNVPEPPPIAQEDEELADQTLVIPGHQAIVY